MTNLISRETASHWYTSNGEPAYTQVAKNGNIRNTTLTDAKKLGLYPSVTTIMKLIAKPQLEIWKQEQAILSALTLPREESETDDVFVHRVVSDFNEQGKSAAEFGTVVHDEIYNYFANNVEPSDDTRKQMISEIKKGFAMTNLTPVAYEDVMVGSGFAGKYDMLCTDPFGKHWVVDFKTQDFKDKVNVYDEWIWQLGAYSLDTKIAENIGGALNVVIQKTNVTNVHFVMHNLDILKQGRKIFLTIFELWKMIKGYDPMAGER